MSKILIIAPHADDETLGCGGSIFRHKQNGDEVHLLIVTCINKTANTNEIKKHFQQRDIATEKYCFKSIVPLDLPSTKIDTFPISDLVQKITNIYKDTEPEIIYSPYIKDVHTDHQLIAKAIQSTLKWFRYPYIKKVLMYETPSETEFNFMEKDRFRPNVFMDISDHLEDKINVMKLYEDQIGEFPFPRGEEILRALAALRGSQSGYRAAEAFELVYQRL
tara:strand:+ start:1028 stop:1687 length:660 start_codon:yes stop_codon:yes gene_type:complete